MKPFAYQVEGANFLAARRRAHLGDGPRCGKTLQAVLACEKVNAWNILVVCPGMARTVWEKTFAIVAPWRNCRVVWDAKDPIEPDGVTILSMDGTRNEELHARLTAHKWDVLILDETHFLKDRNSQRTRQVLSKKGLAGQAGYIWFLSGSAVMNGPQDLWVMLRTIGVINDSYEEYLNKYCVWKPGEYGPVVFGTKNVEELKSLLEPVSLRRTWAQVKGEAMKDPVPEAQWNDLPLDWRQYTPENDPIYLEMMEVANRQGVQNKVKNWIARCQAGYDPFETRGEGLLAAELRRKLSMVKAKPVAMWLVEQFTREEIGKAVIFSHHSLPIQLLHAYLVDFGSKIIYGGTKPAKRERYVDFFWNRADRRVLICQDNIARQAIDLSCASDLIFLEMDWVPENNLQAAMRIQGPRQKNPPRIWTARMPGTLDDAIVAVNLRKTKMVSELFS